MERIYIEHKQMSLTELIDYCNRKNKSARIRAGKLIGFVSDSYGVK